jgi:hypothetical protein
VSPSMAWAMPTHVPHGTLERLSVLVAIFIPLLPCQDGSSGTPAI